MYRVEFTAELMIRVSVLSRTSGGGFRIIGWDFGLSET